MTEPRCTVIIPVYNGERYIAEAIESVLAQTEPCHLIVVNDGSTDETIKVIEHLFGLNENRTLIDYSINGGADVVLNHGIRHATTAFVAWLSHGSSMLLRRDVFERVGFFREDLRVDVDGEMWLRMIGAGMRFVHVAMPLLKYRRHGGQLSANKELMRQTKDHVRAEAIERTPPERAFPGQTGTASGIYDGYRILASAMSAQSLTLAAAAARHKSLDILETPDLHTDL